MASQSVPPPAPMPPDQAAQLADFARAAKAAARAVTLYPATHPAIEVSLGRVVSSAAKLAAAGDVTLVVHPGAILLDGRAAARPDQAVAELSNLLHDRLIGSLRMERAAAPPDWHALLLLLARPPGELIAEGGISRAWAATGCAHFEIGEIDYAEVLRERAAGEAAAWDRIIDNCLRGDALEIDDAVLAAVADVAGDPARFGEFLSRLQDAGGSETKVAARAAALLRIIRGLIHHVTRTAPDALEALLHNVAHSTSRLTPDMMLAMLAQRDGGEEGGAAVVGQIVNRMNDRTIASFVAANIVAERGATGRLAQAFEALVPEADQQAAVLELARDEITRTSLGAESGFEELWQNAASMLMNYSDKPFVSAEYARELSGARAQATEVERVSDDPPDRIQAWLDTVAPDAVRRLDEMMLLDLLALEADADQWRAVASVVAGEIERLTLLGDARRAQPLLDAIAREQEPGGREALRAAAMGVLDTLAAGPLVRHAVLHFRKVDERDLPPFAALCRALGPRVVRGLAEAIAVEENNRALRRLREVLLGFGAAGRQAVEQLKSSPNPAVRRTAIDLLRVFGGREALPELASMLDDADPQVQRESIRAIVQIGTEEAYAVLERALVGRSRDAILQQLISLRDDKAIPLLCYVLQHTYARGKLVNVHLAIIDALGALSAHPETARTLKAVLYSGDWWAPFRTAAVRQAAAASLRRVGGAEATAVLEEAAQAGNRGIRKIARAQVGLVRTTPPRERAKQ